MINPVLQILYLVKNFSLTIAGFSFKIIALMAALIGLRWGVTRLSRWVFGDGQTTGLSRALYKVNSRAGAWWDHETYRPYKGYNRLRSQKWNMEHTM